MALADQLKDLDVLLRSKTQLNSPSVQSDQHHPSSPHSNQTEPPESGHPTDQQSSKPLWHSRSDTIEDAHSDDSMNSPALPSKYLTGGTNLNSTNSSGDQGLESHSTAGLSSELGLLDTSSLMSNMGGDQESKSPHVSSQDNSAEGLGQSLGSSVLGNDSKEEVSITDKQSQSTKSLSPADGKLSKWSFRSRIPRRVHGSSASPPKLIPLRRRSEQPDSGVYRNSISEIRLRKASSPAVLQSKSEGGNINGSLEDRELLAPPQSADRLQVPKNSYLPSSRHSSVAGGTPRRGILKLQSSSVSSSGSSTSNPTEKRPHSQETVSSDRKASSSVGEGLRPPGVLEGVVPPPGVLENVVPEISVTQEEGVAEGRGARGEETGVKGAAQHKEEGGGVARTEDHEPEDDTEQKKSKLTL